MSTAPDWIPQAAAVPVKSGQLCLVTSSSGRRWVIPKGMMEPGKTAGEIALQEAWEEAGLTGMLRPEPLGTYSYDKYGSTCLVTVFHMQVTDVAADWPENHLRQRCWVSPAQAVGLIEERGLREIIRGALPEGGARVRA
jgi:8-oxo-dGTP pyrophosphatase MutT (NUDIX family)